MVEIRVDTKRDSKEDIKKVIVFLEQIIGLSKNGAENKTGIDDYSEVSGFANIFDSGSEGPGSDDTVKEPVNEEAEDAVIEVVEY